MSITQRRKGAAGELEVISMLKAAGWPHAERTHSGRAQRGTGDVRNGPQGCSIEIKRQETMQICKWLDQAIQDADPLDIPIVVCRPSRHEWMAVMPFEDLLVLLASREKT